VIGAPPGPWVDSHCHVPFIDDGAAPDAVVARARDADVAWMVTVGTDLVTSRDAVALAGRHDEDVYATVGLHPHDASRFDDEWDALVALAASARVVAVGECGFDLHYRHSSEEEQERAFRAQVALARTLDTTLVIHTREAWDETFRVLADEELPPRIVFHCFTGGPDEARRALDTGAFLSFSGIVSFRNASDVRAVVLTGSGGNFCSGGDVFEIIEPLTRMATLDLLAFTRMTGDLVKAMRRCPQQIVAAVDGVCAGAGAILAMASDIRLATPEAKTAFLFTRVGLAGADMGACGILPRIIGQGRAAELLYTGRTMSAAEGAAWGFYNALHPQAELEREAVAFARSLADGPWFAHGITKTMMNQEWSMGLDEMIESEAQAQAICMTTGDFRRAFEAFAGKRKPAFEGN